MSRNHNLERHDLFFACIKLVSDNTNRTEWIVREQVKLDCGWIKGFAAGCRQTANGAAGHSVQMYQVPGVWPSFTGWLGNG